MFEFLKRKKQEQHTPLTVQDIENLDNTQILNLVNDKNSLFEKSILDEIEKEIANENKNVEKEKKEKIKLVENEAKDIIKEAEKKADDIIFSAKDSGKGGSKSASLRERLIVSAAAGSLQFGGDIGRVGGRVIGIADELIRQMKNKRGA